MSFLRDALPCRGEHSQHSPSASMAALAFLAGILVSLAGCGDPGATTGAGGNGSTSPPGELPADGGIVDVGPRAPLETWTPPVFDARKSDRDRMVDWLVTEYELTDEAVFEAMAAVPRHEFVPAHLQVQAYDDTPLPIANGQLISQPWIVAFMTYHLDLKPQSKVLEIGTGSGYQAAVLTHYTKEVYSIEIIKPLGESAAHRLQRLGYDPVRVRIADGFDGWPEEAPFDAIIVTCAAGQIPPPLLDQLALGGRMVIPVGQSFAMQSLMYVEKDLQGAIRSKSLAPVKFVPLLNTDPTRQ